MGRVVEDQLVQAGDQGPAGVAAEQVEPQLVESQVGEGKLPWQRRRRRGAAVVPLGGKGGGKAG